MWTAQISDITTDENSSVAKVTYVYTNGIETKEVIERISNPSSIKMIAQNAINELNRIDAIKELIANPPIGDISFSQPEMTEKQFAMQKYNLDRTKLEQMKKDMDLGIISSDNKEFLELLELVKKEYSEL